MSALGVCAIACACLLMRMRVSVCVLPYIIIVQRVSEGDSLFPEGRFYFASIFIQVGGDGTSGSQFSKVSGGIYCIFLQYPMG